MCRLRDWVVTHMIFGGALDGTIGQGLRLLLQTDALYLRI